MVMLEKLPILGSAIRNYENKKIFFNGRFVDPWTEVPEGKLRDKAVEKFVQQHGVKNSMLQEAKIQQLNPKFNKRISTIKNITNWAQTGPSPLNRILPKLFGKAAAKATTIPAAISDVLLGTKVTPGRSDWQLPGFADRDPSTKWYEGWGAEKVFGDKATPKATKPQAPPGRPVEGPHPIPQPVIPKATKPQAPPGRPVSGPHKTYQDTAQDKQEQRERERGGANRDFTRTKYGKAYRKGGTAKNRRFNKYSKGGGVRASKYVL